jgi:UDPglucose 6-dehydrogenase
VSIAVLGLWHLGSVTAAGLAELGYDVIGIDPDEEVIERLNKGQAPLFEPELDDTIQRNLKNSRLCFTNDIARVANTSLVWITYDTPVNENDEADVEWVKNQIVNLFPHLTENSVLMISSQLPVGTTQFLQTQLKLQYPKKTIHFAYSPENLRLGKALKIFMVPDRLIIGVDDEITKNKISTILPALVAKMIFMSIASAEVTKHAINAFLATSVVFINELANLCETVGADAFEVEQGLKSEERIGPKSYLRPGSAFAGGTLARDIQYLITKAKEFGLPLKLFEAVLASNQEHKQWVQRKLTHHLGDLSGKTISLLGLSYKPGTDTLRRSTAIEIASWLQSKGARIHAFDPAVKTLSDELQTVIALKKTAEEALHQADACIATTEWPAFAELTADTFAHHLRAPYVFDPSGFLQKKLYFDSRINYFTLGKSQEMRRRKT